MRVLFLDPRNTARSQIAEGLLRRLGGGHIAVESAGTTAGEVDPLAVQAMAEVGVDISTQRAKSIDELSGAWDVVVTVCDSSCPVPPRAMLVLRWRCPDPERARGTVEERLAAFRRVRDGLRPRVEALARRCHGFQSAAVQ